MDMLFLSCGIYEAKRSLTADRPFGQGVSPQKRLDARNGGNASHILLGHSQAPTFLRGRRDVAAQL